VSHDWEPNYVNRIQARLDNRRQASSERTCMKDATSKLVNISPNVPDAIRRQIEQAQQQIISGEKPVFSGPIVNHRGRTRVKPGEQLSDDDLDRMNWYVDGVKGALLFF
jgi:simple sugar transport system substrate-binding protein